MSGYGTTAYGAKRTFTRKQHFVTDKELARSYPVLHWAYENALFDTVAGHLDAKTRELIAVAVSITLHCDGCITVHTDDARKLGASIEEIAEALGVAVSVNAGAAIVYSTRARCLSGFGRAG
jgi:AhpD family alkylhydroperoxidase